jgi:hypothetical protein
MNLRGMAATHRREIDEIMRLLAARGGEADIRNGTTHGDGPRGKFDLAVDGGNLFSEV